MWQHFKPEAGVAAVGAAVYVGGAVGLEVVSYLLLASGVPADLYLLEVAVEEFLEMAGVSVILYAVLRFASRVTAPPPRAAAS